MNIQNDSKMPFFIYNIMFGSPFYNTLYRINTDCYDLCNVSLHVVYSVESIVKWGTNQATMILSFYPL